MGTSDRNWLQIGGARRDRTADLLHAMQALSQLSYSPTQARTLLAYTEPVKNSDYTSRSAPTAAPRRRHRDSDLPKIPFELWVTKQPTRELIQTEYVLFPLYTFKTAANHRPIVSSITVPSDEPRQFKDDMIDHCRTTDNWNIVSESSK